MNYPVLAHIKQTGNDFLHIIKTAQDWEREKEITKDWSGVTIFPEKNANWKNSENDALVAKHKKQNLYIAFYLFLGLLLWGWATWQYQNMIYTFFGLLSLLGVTVSILSFGVELGYQNEVVKQVCGTVNACGGCESVLKSKYAKGIFGVAPADLSLVYFAVQFAFFLIGLAYPNLISFVISFALIGVLIAAWSIYTQSVKLKQWCALCLTIVGLLVIQAILAGIFIVGKPYQSLSILYGALAFVGWGGIGMLLLLPLKWLLQKQEQLNQKVTEFKKWKTDAELFKMQLAATSPVDVSIHENDLLLGGVDAPIRLTVACNPYCVPCARAHETLDRLLEQYASMLSVQVRLLCNPKDETDKRTIAAKHLFAVTAAMPEKKQEVLTDWFRWMNLDKWTKKWGAQGLGGKNIDVIINKHDEWVRKAAIQFTPTFFVNGCQLPGRYTLDDLEKLIPALAEESTATD